jgi:hypothetical protein
LWEQGFSYDQLGDLAFDGFAKIQPTITYDGGRKAARRRDNPGFSTSRPNRTPASGL